MLATLPSPESSACSHLFGTCVEGRSVVYWLSDQQSFLVLCVLWHYSINHPGSAGRDGWDAFPELCWPDLWLMVSLDSWQTTTGSGRDLWLTIRSSQPRMHPGDFIKIWKLRIAIGKKSLILVSRPTINLNLCWSRNTVCYLCWDFSPFQAKLSCPGCLEKANCRPGCH